MISSHTMYNIFDTIYQLNSSRTRVKCLYNPDKCDQKMQKESLEHNMRDAEEARFSFNSHVLVPQEKYRSTCTKFEFYIYNAEIKSK